jgi:hypothetical protein
MKKNIMIFALGVAAGALIVGFDKVKNAVVEGYNQAKDKINEARQQAETTVTDPKPEGAGDQPNKPADEETK